MNRDPDVEMVEGGLYEKYVVTRRDGKPVGWCFVLEPEKDPAARTALLAYAEAAKDTKPVLAQALREELGVEP